MKTFLAVTVVVLTTVCCCGGNGQLQELLGGRFRSILEGSAKVDLEKILTTTTPEAADQATPAATAASGEAAAAIATAQAVAGAAGSESAAAASKAATAAAEAVAGAAGSEGAAAVATAQAVAGAAGNEAAATAQAAVGAAGSDAATAVAGAVGGDEASAAVATAQAIVGATGNGAAAGTPQDTEKMVDSLLQQIGKDGGKAMDMGCDNVTVPMPDDKAGCVSMAGFTTYSTAKSQEEINQLYDAYFVGKGWDHFKPMIQGEVINAWSLNGGYAFLTFVAKGGEGGKNLVSIGEVSGQ